MVRCNGCLLAGLRERYGDKLVKIGVDWYVRGETPDDDQRASADPLTGEPVRFVAWFMSEKHSWDEDCNLWRRRAVQRLKRRTQR